MQSDTRRTVRQRLQQPSRYRFNETNGALIDIFITNNTGALRFPHCLDFGPDGNLYVASAGNDRVLRYNGTNGAFIDVFATNGLFYPVGLVFRGPHLYVSSQSNDCVIRYNATNGAYVDTFVAANTNILFRPSDITFGPDGNLYVVGRFNNRVVRYDGTTGAFMDLFATNNLAQPFGVRFGPDGNLYVVSGNGSSVQRFNGTNGAFLTTFVTSGSGGLNFPIGLEFGPDGNLYVASLGNNKVARYNGTTGAYIDDFVSAANNGGLNNPNFMIFRPSSRPSLSISLQTNQAVLSWPFSAKGFQVQSASTLSSSTSWTYVTNAGAINSGTNIISVPAANGESFFRLAK